MIADIFMTWTTFSTAGLRGEKVPGENGQLETGAQVQTAGKPCTAQITMALKDGAVLSEEVG